MKIEVTLPTLTSHNHIVDDIERGVKVYNSGGVEFMTSNSEPDLYIAKVPHKGGSKTASVSFTRDGQDIEHHYCDCSWRYGSKKRRPPVCRHVVAAVLAIQGGVVETKIALGKSGTASVIVTDCNTAKSVKSGSLDVFATPMMIALMEQAACECLSDCLEEGQTTVGTEINVKHTAASPIGSEITATATIDFVFGRKVQFSVIACEGEREIGTATHTRMIVDGEKFMGSLKNR